MGGAIVPMVLAATAGSLLTLASRRSMTRIDRLVLASIATASLLLGVCFLNNAVSAADGTGATAIPSASLYQGARHASRFSLVDYAVGNFRQLVSIMGHNG